MAIFEYEVADRSGALTRGRAEADSQGDLILRFREQGRVVLSIRQAGGGALPGGLGGVNFGPLGDAVRQT